MSCAMLNKQESSHISDILEAIKLDQIISLSFISTGEKLDIALCDSKDPPENFGKRSITNSRYAFASIFTEEEPIAVAKLAYKILNEWDSHDRDIKKSHLRDKTKNELSAYLIRKGKRPIAAAKKGTWLCSHRQKSIAPNIERTIHLSVNSFAEMIGKRTLFISHPGRQDNQ